MPYDGALGHLAAKVAILRGQCVGLIALSERIITYDVLLGGGEAEVEEVKAATKAIDDASITLGYELERLIAQYRRKIDAGRKESEG